MFVRIVKLTINESAIFSFQKIFDDRKEKIAAFEGCTYLELLQSKNIFFTYSIWKTEADLENYRNSNLFNETWALVKPLFADKPEAWTCTKLFES